MGNGTSPEVSRSSLTFLFTWSWKVSLARQGTVCFALELFQEAAKLHRSALKLLVRKDATRAKILNNLGVIQYHREEYIEALKSLTSALEIQRQWLDGPVRRDTIVYDAAVTLGNMGKVYLRKKEFDLSYFVFEEACLVRIANSNTLRMTGPLCIPPLTLLLCESFKQQPFERTMILSLQA